jgi:hypothetical protein
MRNSAFSPRPEHELIPGADGSIAAPVPSPLATDRGHISDEAWERAAVWVFTIGFFLTAVVLLAALASALVA